MSVEKPLLGIADYIVLVLMLTASAAIGVYFRFAGGRQRTTDEYFLAGKDMSLLPVCFSVMATYNSAIAILGISGEMYTFGSNLALMNIGSVIGTVVVAYVFLPVYFDIGVSGAYEYLEKRFGKVMRTICSIAFAAQMILYMAVVLYAPAIALNAATDLAVWVSVVFIGAVCTFYCTFGGMKAVLWTDFFQALLMYICLFTIIIKGCLDVGGIRNVFTIAAEGGRLLSPSFSADPTTRYTMWNLIFSGTMYSLSSFGASQIHVQRLLTVRNAQRSQKVLLFSLPMNIVFHLMNCLSGIILYANFAGCDPMTSPIKAISSADQLLPYYALNALRDFPGLSGLCLCGIFSASLSSVSSAINSLTAVTVQDLIAPVCAKGRMAQAATAKIITLFYGVLCIGMTFLAPLLGNLIQATFIVMGMFAGPVAGAFVLGMMTTRTNEKGAVTGLIAAIAIAAWISIGATSYTGSSKSLPVSIEECPSYNSSSNDSHWSSDGILKDNVTGSNMYLTHNFTSTIAPQSEDQLNKDTFYLYKVSYHWFSTIGFVCSVIIGYASSIIISIFTKEKRVISPKYISPVARWIFKIKQTDTEAKDICMLSTKLQSQQAT